MHLLSYFISKDHLSIYQIHKAEEDIYGKRDYKSTHKSVQRLIELKLIEQITDGAELTDVGLERGAKYYRLSEEGLFALYINYRIYFPRFAIPKEGGKGYFADFSKGFIKRYSKYNFFNLFLYTWIEHNTIENCSEELIRKINTCLNDICIFITRELRSSGFLISSDSFFNLRDLAEGIYKVARNPFLSFLGKFFDLTEDKVRVKAKDEMEIINISSLTDEPIIQIRLREDENEIVIVSSKNNRETLSTPAVFTKEKDVLTDISNRVSERHISSLRLIYFKAIFPIIFEYKNKIYGIRER